MVALGSGGTADELAADPLWAGAPNLLPLPMEEPTFQSLLAPPGREFDGDTREAMAREVHRRYVAEQADRLPPNMRPWDKLDETFRKANREQARHAVRILEAAGFVVKAPADPASLVIFDANDFTTGEIERMAQLEHGRWNVERVRSGWRYGAQRDDARKIHDNIVRWATCPTGSRSSTARRCVNSPRSSPSPGWRCGGRSGSRSRSCRIRRQSQARLD